MRNSWMMKRTKTRDHVRLHPEEYCDFSPCFPGITSSTALSKPSWEGQDRDYTYEELLKRVFDIMHDKNPDYVAGEKKKIVMRPPQVLRVGTKRTPFANFTDICKTMRRQPKHFIGFLLAELGK